MFYALLLIIFAAFVGCSDGNSSSPLEMSKTDDSRPDMILVKSAGKSVYLGTNDKAAKSAERPRMKVSFDYDFQLGSHEVTCGEFNELMSSQVVLLCPNEKLPAVNVNYFDAVLFANAKSKAENLDTAYSYGASQFDLDGHCVGLEGLSFDTSVKAYRLPTEAEWSLVGANVWYQKKGWLAGNSGYRAHEVCDSSATVLGVCDMVGNVKEWVYDWFGNFKDTSVTNFLGAPKGNTFGERVIKGGSFLNEKASVELYNRGDTYVVSSSTRNDYVGFRLAFGAIPDPVWLYSDGLATSSPISPLLNSSSIREFVGSYQSKLVFRNDVTGHLAYIDYHETPISVHEFQDSLNAYHPDISPDGKWVAFCTGMEGVDSPSKVYVRKLDVNDNDVLELDVESAVIPRFKVNGLRDTVIVFVTSAANNRDESSHKKASTWQVPFAKGVFGTPQKLFDGSYHGGVSRDNQLAVSGARLLRTRVGNMDTIWYNGEQACNVSLSKDSSNRTLFLDFASETGKNFSGTSYGVHERILVVDSSGRLIQSVPAPRGYSFDHTEWTNKDNIAVATIVNANGAHTKISLVNMKDSSVVNLVAGEELWHPCFWTKSWYSKNEGLDMDSAGVYLMDDDSWASAIMRYKMELLWKYHGRADVAVVGSSRPMEGISPATLGKHYFTLNFGQTPNSIFASRDFLDRYIFNHLEKLKHVVVSLDIDFWWKIDGPKSDNFFARDYSRYPGYVYDENHNFWKDGVPIGLREATENSLGVENSAYYTGDLGRFLAVQCNSWGDIAEVTFDSTYTDKHPELLDNSFNALVHIIEESAKRNINVVGLIFPQSPKYRNTGAFGHSGLRRSVAVKLIEKIKKLEETYPNFVLMDENKMGNHDYADEMAWDNDHLCSAGAEQISMRLDSLLQGLDKRKK